MTLRRTWAPALALLVLAACSSSGSGTPSSASGSQSAAACSQDAAPEIHQVVVGTNGFGMPCGRVAKGTDVFFLNDTDRQVEVTLSGSGSEDFDAQLPQRGSTYAHAFAAAGTYVVTANPQSSVTIYVTG